jgi:hypothetical protein
MPVVMPEAVPPPVAPYGGLTTPLPEDTMPQGGKPKREAPPRERVLLLVLLVVVLAGAAYYVIHKSSNNSGTQPPLPAPNSQTLSAPPSTTPANSAPTSATTATRRAQQIEADLRLLAVSEETYLTDYRTYTTSSAALRREGFRPDRSIATFAGIDGAKGYCLVGGGRKKGPFILYDSQHGGLQKAMFPTGKSAGQACSDKAIKSAKSVH